VHIYLLCLHFGVSPTCFVNAEIFFIHFKPIDGYYVFLENINSLFISFWLLIIQLIFSVFVSGNFNILCLLRCQCFPICCLICILVIFPLKVICFITENIFIWFKIQKSTMKGKQDKNSPSSPRYLLPSPEAMNIIKFLCIASNIQKQIYVSEFIFTFLFFAQYVVYIAFLGHVHTSP
jgi:hypothetical protein